MGAGFSQKEVQEWEAFIQGLRERNRFKPLNEAYVADLIAGCLGRRKRLASGTSLFRSRIMPLDRSLDGTPLSPEEMGPPPSTFATAGRLNPEGIRCLYGALEEDTAVAEVRPWTAARLTVAEFKILSPVEVLDLIPVFGRGARSDSLRLRFLSLNIARPVHRDDRWGYLGTQYLAETLKAEGVAGLLYQSALRRDGRNVALFSDIELGIEAVKLYEVNSVSYTYGPPR